MRTILFLSLLSFGVGQLTDGWKISADYAVKFSAKKAVGTFDKLEGDIAFDPSAPGAGRMNVWVETASINTGNKTKDKHARGKKWLNAEEYPSIGFKSSAIRQTAEGYQVTGEISLRGKTKTVSFPFSFEDQIFSGNFVINRQDFGIEGPFLFGGLVGDEITVTIKVPVTRK